MLKLFLGMWIFLLSLSFYVSPSPALFLCCFLSLSVSLPLTLTLWKEAPDSVTYVCSTQWLSHVASIQVACHNGPPPYTIPKSFT